jgi:hypothetical protein
MADESIRIEYNQDLQALETLLSQVRRAGDYFVNGTREIPMPQVAVEDVGTLSFPVLPAQAEALIRQAIRAPYGRGEETILDESVRKVWQIAPEKVRIGGKSWKANFDGILEQAAIGLGCEGMPISAELYKLLIYDPRSCRRSHSSRRRRPGSIGFGNTARSLCSGAASTHQTRRGIGARKRISPALAPIAARRSRPPGGACAYPPRRDQLRRSPGTRLSPR